MTSFTKAYYLDENQGLCIYMQLQYSSYLYTPVDYK
jgi:hypothetical protein